jgi:hypothetical protein
VTFSLAFYLTPILVIGGAAFVVLLVASEIGWRLGHGGDVENDSFRTLVGGIAGATLGILGLLLGFTLSMAIARFDARRAVIVDEANAIGTLWLRAGLLDAPLRTELRDALREYADARIALGRVGSDLERLRAARRRGGDAQHTVWSVIERAARTSSSPAVASALITSTNEMIDLDELRMASLENYVPAQIMLLLVGVAAVAFAFLGWSFGAAEQRSTISMVLLALLVTTVLAVILDISRPHRGLIRVSDQSLVRARQAMDAAP